MNETHERMTIELLDLGDATVETRQWSPWPRFFDSVFLLGLPDS
jgi:hypothetical protein